MTSGVLSGSRLGLPDLDALLISGLAAERFREAGLRVDRVEPNYVRLKPGTNALIGYKAHRDAEGERLTVPIYVRTFANGKARILGRRWDERRAVPTALGPGARLLRTERSVVFVFPNDDGLRGLHRIVSNELEDALQELLGVRMHRRVIKSLVPIRYKPERRFIASCVFGPKDGPTGPEDEERFYLRFFPDGRGNRIVGTAHLLQAHAGYRVVPTPVGTVLDGRLSLEEEVQGVEILRAILDRRTDAAELGEALSRIHGCQEGFGPPRTPQRVLAGLAGAWDMAAAIDEGLGRTGHEVVATLAKALPDERPAVLVHGDLALHNILYSREGPVLVDLERAGMGDPLEDLGQLVAHIREVALGWPAAGPSLREFEERLVEAYARASGEDVPAQRLGFFTAAALADRAAGSIIRRGLDVWWPARAVELLRLALDASQAVRVARSTFFVGDTAGRSGLRWEVFYPRLEPKWPGFVQDASGRPAYGVYDAHSDSFMEVNPEDDAGLPALARWLSHGELVKYRVGRRATIRIPAGPTGPGAYVKVMPPHKARKVLRRHRGVERALASLTSRTPVIPAIQDAAPDEGVVVVAALPGRSLRDIILERSPFADRALEICATAVAQFHQIPGAALDVPQLRPAAMEPRDYAALAIEHAPDRASAYRSALEEVEKAIAEGMRNLDRVVHGDLHDGNLLVEDDRPAILDLDLVHRGDPMEDIGNLAAHLFLRGLQRGDGIQEARRMSDAFIHAYSRAGGAVDRRSVRGFGASVLFRLSSIYLFRRRWRTLTDTLLAECVRWVRLSTAESPTDAQDVVDWGDPAPHFTWSSGSAS